MDAIRRDCLRLFGSVKDRAPPDPWLEKEVKIRGVHVGIYEDGILFQGSQGAGNGCLS